MSAMNKCSRTGALAQSGPSSRKLVASSRPVRPAQAFNPRKDRHERDDGSRSVSSLPMKMELGGTMRMQRPGKVAQTGNPVADFVNKVKLAWRIFFPEQKKVDAPREEVKKRLRMVLVADRCGMNPASLSEMKKHIVKALAEFVDIEGEDGIEVSISSEPEVGTVYSVNIPIRRVKPEARFGPGGLPDGEVADGITIEWDPESWDKDPAARFPMGC